jgi:hypothetical protein
MSNHEHFEELCVMAAMDEISVAKREELRAHLEQCASCRTMVADMNDVHAKWFPQRPDFEIERSATVESRFRRSILDRVTAAKANSSELVAASKLHSATPRTLPWTSFYPSQPLAASILIVLALFAMITQVTLRHRTSKQAPIQAPAAALHSSAIGANSTTAGSEASRPFAEEAQTVLELALKKSQGERKLLEQRLKDAEHETKDVRQINSNMAIELTQLRQQLDSVRENEAEAQEELASLKSTGSEREAEVILVRGENQDLRERLAVQTASLDRERDLMSAGREIRDLIAARNLHIIDVYDTTGEGKTQRAFGRVFYTEGKSLVFYAYDLLLRHPASKYAYFAWGKRDDKQSEVHKLGIFYNDDQSQKRWVLQINDPQMLSEIDSVFVTLEPADNPGTRPSGKQVLSAYLGSSPNHP